MSPAVRAEGYETVLRYTVLTGKDADGQLLHFEPVRGLGDFKSAEVTIEGKTIRVVVIYGTAALERYLPEVLDGYHFVEVMTCPGGCISGGGQPGRGVTPVQDSLREARALSLYQSDSDCALKTSLKNPEVRAIYKEFYGEPTGEKSKRMLHTSYYKR